MSQCPHSKYIVRGHSKGSSKVKCEKCGRIGRIKGMAIYKDKLLCCNCKPNKI